MKKKKIFLIIFGVVLALVFLVTVFLFLRHRRSTEVMDEVGAATSAYALQTLANDFAGESRIDSYCGVKAGKGTKDPAEAMVKASTFLIDQEAIDKKVAEMLSGLESTADASGMTVDALLLEQGYDDVGAYESAAREEILAFVKNRLVIYTAASDLKVKITESEYEERLPAYAQKFGYASTEDFSYACAPGTIACEMLYDKTVETLTGEGGEP